MTEVGLSRRHFLRIVGMTSALAMATACAATTTAPTQETPTEAPTTAPTAVSEPTTAPVAAKYSESPMLSERAAQGSLPPVDERLPVDPLVVECIDEPGEYSDSIRRIMNGPSDFGCVNPVTLEGFARWDLRSGDLKIVPNIAESWDIEDDGRTYIFHLRPGMKWSDGEPFTADDLVFWHDDVVLNPEIKGYPSWLRIEGETAVLEKIDDYTVAFKFPVPHGILIESMCFQGYQVIAPKHYLSQFHVDYADPDELKKAVADAKLEQWYQLFQNKNDNNNNPDLPVLWAWKVTQPLPGQTLVFERNPHYWKVDTTGKQLPYFDRFLFDVAGNHEVIMMKTIAGECDYQYRHMGFSDISFLKEHESEGDYTIVEWTAGPIPSIQVNQTIALETGLRELFQTRDFRHALSYAFDRQELNDLFWFGMATPYNPAGNPRDPTWREGFGSVAIEYDPEKANQLLDSVGLDKRDGDGWRLRPDGERLQLLMEVYPSETGAPTIDIITQIADAWREVGIEAQAREIERSLWAQRAAAGEFQMLLYDMGTILWILYPNWYVPLAPSCYWAQAYAQWEGSGGETGEKPPEEYQRLVDWFYELKSSMDEQTRIELGQKILGQHSEEVYQIGTCLIDILPLVRKNDLVNVLENGMADYRLFHEAISWPFQIWRRPA